MATTLEILEAERRRALEGAAAKEAAAKEAAAAAAAESARAEKIARVMADLQELGLSLAAPIEPQAVVPDRLA